jgi:uncharacterized membrane protein YjgN (DUF898 family)
MHEATYLGAMRTAAEPPPVPEWAKLPGRSPHATPILFAGENGDFRRLVTRGAIAELFTLGFYRFWLATDIRRHLWSRTSIGGDAFDYLGTGRELFFGFLFAVAILAPFYLLYFLIGIEAERFKAFASFPLVLLFVAFRQFAIYRARRYRLNRTSWRGLRFGMSGSGWRFAALAIAWNALVFLTLGLALPWAAAALERYKMKHTFYGELPGRFEGTGRRFFARGWWLWLAPLVYAVAIFVSVRVSGTKPGPGLVALVSLTLVLFPFWYAAFKAIEWKWWLEGLRLGDVSIASSLRTGTMIANYWKFAGMALVIVLAALVVIGSAAGVLGGLGALKAGAGKGAPLALVASAALTYLLTFLAIGIVMRIYLTQRIWKLVCGSAIIHGIEAAENVTARDTRATALGEGFADSLDIVGF